MKQTALKLINSLSSLILILAICLTLFSVAAPRQAIATWDGTVAASFASGSGTEASPYVINTQAQLGYFVEQLAGGVTYEGKYIELGKSLDMTGAVWTYDHGNEFMGSFDGQGYTITADCPFLGNIGTGGVVQGLNYVANMQVDRALICDYNYGTINSCTVRGNVHMDLSQMVYAGLICSTNTSSGVVKNCGAIGDLYAYGDDYSAYAAMIPRNQGSITDCFSAVTLYALGTGKYSEEVVCPLTNGYNAALNCFYNSDLYTGTAHCGLGLSTAEMTGSAFLNSLVGTSSPGSKWVAGSDGYPELAHCYDNYAYLSGYEDATQITYHTTSASFTVKSAYSCTRIYYTTDGSIPTTSSSYTYNGYTISVADDTILTVVPYSTSAGLGTVSRYTITELAGSGTESAPYKIYTKQQLDAVRNFPDKYFKLMNDLTYTDADFAFGGVASGGWNPISGFSGYFDGNEMAITGLAGGQGGMFDINTGTITSLRLLEHRLYGISNFGAIANTNSGTITRCYVKSAWTANDLPPDLAPSGGWPLVGGIAGNNYSGTISYCRNDGLVVSFGAVRYGTVSVGGIAGESGTVESCINTGDLLILRNQHADEAYFAGFTGDGYVRNCRGSADILIQNSFDYPIQIGAITAENYQARLVQYSIADPYTVTWDLSGSYLIPGYDKFSISSNNRYSYVLDTNLTSAYPDLDFETLWMLSDEGPVPQGVADSDGHCYRLNGSFTEPGCTISGSISLICDLCGDTMVDTISELGHTFANYTSNGDATCLDDGTKTGTCVRCTATNTVADEGSALGHSFTVYVSNGDATCTEAGTQSAVCDRDGCSVTDTQPMDALGHTYSSIKSNVLKQAATCTTPAYFYCLCGVCSEVNYDSEIDSGSALGHLWTSHECDWAEDLSSAAFVGTCQRIGCSSVMHSNATISNYAKIEPTCTEGGSISATATGTFDGKVYTYTETIDYGTAEGHVYESVVTAPNCTEAGYTTHTCANCSDHYTDTVTEATGHDYSDVITKPTCTQEGYTTHTCSNCGDIHTDSVTEATGHDYEAVITDPTCTEDGYTTHTCNNCDDVYTDSIAAATGHAYVSVITDPSCTDEGYTTHRCSSCSDSYTDSVTAATGHDYTAVVTDPTCTDEGYTTHTCDNCGDVYTDSVLSAKGHDWVEATCISARTCSVCDMTEGNALGHEFVDYIYDDNATCTEDGTRTAKCERCNETDTSTYAGSMLGHDYNAVVTDATCTDGGYTTHTCIRCPDSYTDNQTEALDHSFTRYLSNDDASCTSNGTETAKCDRCEQTNTREAAGSALGHDWGSWITLKTANCQRDGQKRRDCASCDEFETEAVTGGAHVYGEWAITQEPTCTEGGIETQECKYGDSSKTNVLPANGHDMGQWTQEKPATCTEKGMKVSICSNCTYRESEVIPASGHDFIEEVTAPDCTSGGFTTYTCHCGHSYTDDAVDPLGHDYNFRVTNADCENSGYTTYTCKICEYSYAGDEVKPLGHDYVSEVTEPDCKNGGFTTHTCSRCAESYIDSNIKPLEHSWDEGIVTVEPDEYTSGMKEYTCSRCSEIIEETLAALGHTHKYTSAVTPATCTADGYTTHTCACGTTYKDSPVTATGHSYGQWYTYRASTCTSLGEKRSDCAACGDYQSDTIAVKEHSYSKYYSDDNATCTVDGTKTAKCDNCTMTRTIADTGSKLGHSWSEWEQTKLPTSVSEGEEMRSCVNCGSSEFRAVEKLTHPFVDVPAGKFYEIPVIWAVDQGITNGVDPTHFVPDRNCSRAEAVTFLWRASGKPEPTSTYNPFTDVKEGTFYYTAVLWAVEEGITNGMSSTTFEPGTICNRGHVATFLWRALGQPGVSNPQNPFEDVAEGRFYYDAVLWAVENGVTNGMTPTSFAPDSSCTRGQIVTFLYRALALEK